MIRPSPNQFILVALLFAIVLNTVVHYTHPAYRHYQKIAEQLDSKYSSFVDSVRRDFVPALQLSITGRVSSASYPSLFPSNCSPVVSSDVSVRSSNSISNDYLELQASYSVANGRPLITFQGVHFYEGDDLFGSVIISIRPTFLRTYDHRFRLVYDRDKQTTSTASQNLPQTNTVSTVSQQGR